MNNSGYRWCFLVVLGVSPAHSPGDEPPDVAKKTLIPWVEINSPTKLLQEVHPDVAAIRPRMHVREYGLEGLAIWSKVTNTAIVTTGPGQWPNLYPWLTEHKPQGMRIIGGVKTYTLPGARPNDDRPYDFANVAGWKAIAEDCKGIAKSTGVNIVLLENETALEPYHTCAADIDLDKLRDAMAVLRETGIEFWWYFPTILPNSNKCPDREAKTERFVRVVADALPNARFLPGFTSWKGWEDTDEVARRQRMMQITGLSRFREQFLVRVEGYIAYGARKKPVHTPKEMMSQMAKLDGQEFIVYPGAVNWVTMAREFAMLVEGNSGEKP